MSSMRWKIIIFLTSFYCNPWELLLTLNLILFQCNPGIATDALFDFIYRKPRLAAVIGSGCSGVTETLAEIVPYWNTVLVSFCILFVYWFVSCIFNNFSLILRRHTLQVKYHKFNSMLDAYGRSSEGRAKEKTFVFKVISERHETLSDVCRRFLDLPVTKRMLYIRSLSLKQ